MDHYAETQLSFLMEPPSWAKCGGAGASRRRKRSTLMACHPLPTPPGQSSQVSVRDYAEVEVLCVHMHDAAQRGPS